jgi:hypothetical protein
MDADTTRISLLFCLVVLDFRGVVEDIKMLISFRLPEAMPVGLLLWFRGLYGVIGRCIMWWILVCSHTAGTSPVLTETVLHVHKFLTVFIETYFWAHGAMGLPHIFLTVRSQKNPVTE